MRVTEVQCITSAYTEHDVNELAAVMQSTFNSSQASTLRWSKVNTSDATEFMRQACTRSLADEFKMPRMSTMDIQAGIPSIGYAEHLVVRDLDMDHLDGEGTSPIPGRVVAHADYKFHPSLGDASSDQSAVAEINKREPSMAMPAGFNTDLNLFFTNLIVGTIFDVFRNLPCFNLEGISTLTPSHLRKGIAKKLVEWVYPIAEGFGLPVVLAASPAGLGLYRKCGFIEYRKYDVVIDLAKWGGEGEHRHVIMVHWPNDLDRMPTVWKQWRELHHDAGTGDVKA